MNKGLVLYKIALRRIAMRQIEMFSSEELRRISSRLSSLADWIDSNSERVNDLMSSEVPVVNYLLSRFVAKFPAILACPDTEVDMLIDNIYLLGYTRGYQAKELEKLLE